MKSIILLVFFIAGSSAFDEGFTKKLFVPYDTEEYLKNLTAQGIIEQQRDERIANGFDAEEGQFPYVLRLTIHDTDGAVFVCSGVLIADDHFLTVRHCFDPILTFMVMAFTGTVHRDAPGWIYRVSSQFWFAPPIDGWNPDLAVCRLDTPFTITDRIAPIRLPSRSQMESNYGFEQYPINIVGWGRMADMEMAQTLQWARFRIETDCWIGRRPTHMCSVPVEGWHIETRGGDSGGPWMTYEDGIPTVIALHEGSTGNPPGGQIRWWFRGTRLTSFLAWISSVSGIPIRD